MEREVLELPETSKHETSPPAKTYLWLLRQRCRYWILNARSIEMANQLGPEAAATFDHKAKDKTHLNPKGADATAKLVADEIRKMCRNSPNCSHHKRHLRIGLRSHKFV
jgi:hypothetical protein